MIRINLLPIKAVQKKEMLLGQLIVLGGGLVVVVAACGVFYMSMAGKVHAVETSIAEKEQEAERLKRTIGEVGKIQKLQKELQGKMDVLAQLKAGKSGPVHLLDELSLAVSEKLWITSFKEAKGAINISGFGGNEEVVAQFLQALEQSPFYQKVELQVIEQASQSEGKVHKFSIISQAEPQIKPPSPSN